MRAKADHYARIRKRLQQKGTRSATRRMIAMSGRERRLKLQTNHTIAKSIVQAHPHTLIGLEELTGIRERTRRRKRRRKKNGKGTELVSRQGASGQSPRFQMGVCRTAQRDHLQGYTAGSLAIKVDANYTSKACPLCGYTDKRNRPGNGLTVRLSERAVSSPTADGPAVHPARGPGRCAQYRDADASHPTGLGENGRLVSTP